MGLSQNPSFAIATLIFEFSTSEMNEEQVECVS